MVIPFPKRGQWFMTSIIHEQIAQGEEGAKNKNHVIKAKKKGTCNCNTALPRVNSKGTRIVSLFLLCCFPPARQRNSTKPLSTMNKQVKVQGSILSSYHASKE
ncbi:hypothetical protein V6N11_077449 [Hibiscus sabdariffa]|uniref:Uncharacterized protein n=1 Tax=Hibiscus sabdariffa TaxID=183260 RepID=A0ABR2TDZ8_9ROSI